MRYKYINGHTIKIKINTIIFFSTIFLILLFNTFSLSAQTKPNSIYFEALGSAVIYSINYDRLFTENFGGRIGFMYLSELDFIFVSAKDLLFIPVTLNYFVGGKHKLELGAGAVFAGVSSTGAFGFKSGNAQSNIVGTATIGYRFQKSKGGFLFRISFTPFFTSKGIVPYGGVSMGMCF